MKLFSKAKDLFDGGKKEDLIDHVWKQDMDYIKTVDPNVLLKARDVIGNTGLLIATICGNLDLCQEILKECPSLLYNKNKNNQTVLNLAANPSYRGEGFLFIDFFVSVGINELATSNEGDVYMMFKRWMKTQDFRGDTALVAAARCGNLHVVKRFIEVDCQYNLGLSKVVGLGGKTALDCAVENKDHEMIKLLTDEGDPYSDFVSYSTAMDLFDRVKRGDLDYIKTVKLQVLLNSRDKFRMSALCIATKCDQLDCCKEILKRCPSLLYHQNINKRSVLHHAAEHKNDRLIDFFVSTGLDEAARSEGSTKSMKRFEKWINMKDTGDHTVLISAVITRNNHIVKTFAELDCQYKLGLSELVDSKKKTALQFEDHEMIKTLTGNIPISITMQQAQESQYTGNSSGTEGKDATTNFKKAHSHSGNAVKMMDEFYVGVVDSITSSLSKLASDKPQPYSRDQLKEFTKDFSQLLGSGGFGDVYKGQFPDGVFIAVKVLKNIEFKEKVMEEQFVAEVDTMGRAYHRNLIKLYGYCYEANTKFKALVYDYMENGSFDTILFEKKVDVPWAKLHNIAKEIAQGISYLHESCYPQIIHQDIKPSNVLLDSNLSPKVIDFGLAKVNKGESQFEQTKIKGSRDYMAPEVNQLEQVKLSCKVDVYSFGKMLFDILGSKRNYVEKSGFSGQVWEKYKIDQLDKFILDCGVKEEDKENAKRLAIIALLCVEHNPRARPMLSNVVKMLEGKIKLDTPVAPFYPDYYSSESSSMSDSRDY